MTQLVDFEKLRLSARFDGDYADALIALKLDEASAIVLDYLKLEAVPDAWAAGVPGSVQSATILVAQNLIDGEEPLSSSARSLLIRHRDPAFA